MRLFVSTKNVRDRRVSKLNTSLESIQRNKRLKYNLSISSKKDSNHPSTIKLVTKEEKEI